jgi:hypothetical protein
MPAVTSPALIAALVYGACGLMASAAVQFMLRALADEAGVNRWIFVAVPGLFAMLFAMVVYQDAQKKVRAMGESVSRGILVALLTWVAFSALATWVRCPTRDFGECFSGTLIASGIVGGGPMLAAALVGGLLTGALIIRPKAAPGKES